MVLGHLYVAPPGVRQQPIPRTQKYRLVGRRVQVEIVVEVGCQRQKEIVLVLEANLQYVVAIQEGDCVGEAVSKVGLALIRPRA